MAEDIADDLIYLLQLDLQYKDFLGQIRHWDNLKMAADEGSIWVTNFTMSQLDKVEFKSVPFAKLFYAKDNLLFPRGSMLPARKMPALLWTPVERALPIKLEGYNHNLFEIHGKIALRLIPCTEEQQASILLTSITEAATYIETAAAVRLRPLQWTIIDKTHILIKGNPLLPLNGKAYWQKGHSIFPVGFMPEFPILEEIITEAIDAKEEHLIWWKDELNYGLLRTTALQPLSIASWRQTVDVLKHENKTEL